jgi:hypothetical protein
VRARVFLREGGSYALAAELTVEGAEEVWRRLEVQPELAGRRMAAGDVVYVGDLYLELNADGGWQLLEAGELTRQLYRQVLKAAGLP